MNFFKLFDEMQQQQMQMPQQQQQGVQTQAPQPIPAAQPQQNTQMPTGQGASQPVPPVDQNLLQGMKSLKNVKDPKFQQAFQNFQKQMASLGMSLPNL
jgi:hypothetical protein